jgi:MFS family permease
MHIGGHADAISEKGLDALVKDGVYSQALGVLTGGALLTGCAVTLGASPEVLGLLAAVPFFGQVAHIPAILLIERLRRRKQICVAATLAGRLLLLPLAAVPLVAEPAVALGLLIACFALVTPLGAIGGCAWMSWTRDLVPEHRLGEIFARRQLRANLSSIVAGLLGAGLVDGLAKLWPDWPAAGYVGVFAMAIGAALVSTYYLTRMPDVPMAAPSRRPLGSLLLRPLAEANYRRLMLFLGSWSLAVNLAQPFFAVYLISDLGYGVTTAVLLGILAQLANIAALPSWGRISDRFSNKLVIRVCAPMLLCCVFAWVVSVQPAPHALTLPLIALAQLVLGAASAGLDLACGNIALKLAPRGEATVYLGANALVKSLCAGVAPIAGGLLAGQIASGAGPLVLRWPWHGSLTVLQLHTWHIFFLGACALGLLALRALPRIEEPGDVPASRPLTAIARTLLGRLVRPLRWRAARSAPVGRA